MAIYNLDDKTDTSNELLRVNSLHALTYCHRLFYLEEVEEYYTQNEDVFQGRRIHVELEKAANNDQVSLSLDSVALGIRGRVDAIKTKNGAYVPYEHKIGKCRRDEDGIASAWPSDRIQVLAYGMLIEATMDKSVRECRIRYHTDNITVTIPLDDAGREEVLSSIKRARELRNSLERPPVTDNEKLCVRCSLAAVCLPEEVRFIKNGERVSCEAEKPLRLFPPDDDRKVVHIVEPGARVSRSGERLKVEYKLDEKPPVLMPISDVGQIVIHGYSQISTQCVRLCVEEDIGLHYLTGGGNYLGSFLPAKRTRVQQKIRQFQALTNQDFCLNLAKRLVDCRADMQRQVLMRGLRRGEEKPELARIAKQMKILQRHAKDANGLDRLRGFEGSIGALYFSVFGKLLGEDIPEEMSFSHRNRRPPKDRVNALLGYGYGVLLKDVVQAIHVVGLEPAFGFYHQPRSSAPPLALDVMEIFRVLLVDIPVLNSINRQQWDPVTDFIVTNQKVWLSNEGKKKFLGIYERRKADSWKHPVIEYSMNYSRILELEVRLLEKEWISEGGLFARLRLR